MAANRMLLNSGANFAARVVSAVLNLASVPVFVRVLGGESFGVMAFVIAVQGFLGLLDLGLSATISREIAREHEPARRRDLARTLATIYWVMAAVVLIVMLGLAYWASHFWLRLVLLTPGEVWLALSLAGAAVAVRWPTAIYFGALQGMERQVESNLWSSAFSVIRIGGGVLVAVFVSPRLEAVFLWQLAAAGAEVVGLRFVARKHLLATDEAAGTFRREIVVSLWRTALGFSAVGALGTIGANIDRVLLAHFLPVTELGLYSSIATLTGALTVIGVAVSSAAFPRLARAASGGNEVDPLAIELRRALGLILWPTVPVCLLLLLAHGPILGLWLGASGGHGEAVMLVLVTATLFNAVANPFYTAAMAGGHAGFLLRINSGVLIILLPYYLVMLPREGALAAAGGVLIQNVILVVSVIWRYRSCLPPRSWVLSRLGNALFCAGVIGAAVQLGRWSQQGVWIVAAGVAATVLLVASLGASLPQLSAWGRFPALLRVERWPAWLRLT